MNVESGGLQIKDYQRMLMPTNYEPRAHNNLNEKQKKKSFDE